jgi:hypothetical protein
MNTEVTFRFYVSVASPAGADVEETTLRVEFATDDDEHAMELAERYWPTVCPVNFIPGTLTFA